MTDDINLNLQQPTISINQRQSRITLETAGLYFESLELPVAISWLSKEEIAGENIDAYQVVIRDDSEILKASADNVHHAYRVMGLSLSSASIGGIVQVTTSGTVTNPAWNWNPDLPILVGLNGQIAQYEVLGAAFICAIGTALDATTINVRVKDSILL